MKSKPKSPKKTAKKTKAVTSKPVRRKKKRREVHTRRRELTVEELGRVVARLKGEMRVLFADGIYTGLRLGDCSMLEWGQVDFVRGFISLVPRKTARKNGRSSKPMRRFARWCATWRRCSR